MSTNFLIKKKWINQNSILAMKSLISKKINLAFQYAKHSPFPKTKELLKYLYK